MADRWVRDAGIFLAAGVCGVASGLFGIGGGILLVPLLVLLFSFGQHRAQGTSLVALVPPTGLLAFIAYARVGDVSWKTGLLLTPGVFLGAIAGAWLAKRLKGNRMRQAFVTLLLLLGLWQSIAALRP